MTQATSMIQAEHLAETAKWADQWAAGLQRDLERAELDRDGVQLSFPTARAERLIEGLQAIAELLRGLQRAPTADPNRK